MKRMRLLSLLLALVLVCTAMPVTAATGKCYRLYDPYRPYRGAERRGLYRPGSVSGSGRYRLGGGGGRYHEG